MENFPPWLIRNLIAGVVVFAAWVVWQTVTERTQEERGSESIRQRSTAK